MGAKIIGRKKQIPRDVAFIQVGGFDEVLYVIARRGLTGGKRNAAATSLNT